MGMMITTTTTTKIANSTDRGERDLHKAKRRNIDSKAKSRGMEDVIKREMVADGKLRSAVVVVVFWNDYINTLHVPSHELLMYV